MFFVKCILNNKSRGWSCLLYTSTFGAYRIQKDISIQDMMENALLAHKNAKTRGKGNVVWYDQNLLDKIYQEGLIINQMHRALIDGEFQMFLQPKFKIPSLEIVGAEALVRWHMSDGKILYPDEFIPLFESNGFIYDLDFSILEQACQFIHERQLYHFIIAVNFSRVTIHHKDFYERFKGIIERYQIPVKCLEIEITESAFNDLSSTILNMLMKMCIRDSPLSILMMLTYKRGRKMFGYIVVNKPELKFKEFDIYQSYYCGLCQTLRNQYGLKAQVSLNFDMTFLAMLLSLLYDVPTKKVHERCVIHPMKKHDKLLNDCIDYAAKMTIVLAYYKCQDDWMDERKPVKQIYKKMISSPYLKIKEEYPKKIKVIEENLQKINAYEKENYDHIDDLAGCFRCV